jgi:hypothetical protein
MERLSEIVRDYDPSHEDDVETKMKDEVWVKITQELNYENGKFNFIVYSPYTGAKMILNKDSVANIRSLL